MVGLSQRRAVRPCFGAALAVSLAATAFAAPQEGSADLYRPARARALVIGAGDYERLGRLRYARADAEVFADALVQDLGFARDDVRVLVDGPEADPLRTPTLGHVRTEIADLLADPARAATDLFVLYFSGHGVSADGGDFLLPTDVGPNNARADGVAVRELVGQLVESGAENVLLVLDACRDGARHPFGAEVLALAREARLAVLLSTGPGQQSYESATKGHGLFTHYLERALRRGRAWDPVSGALWASRLGAEASTKVHAYTSEGFDVPQEPQVHLPPGEDVLLAARLPDAVSAAVAAGFAGEVLTPGSRAYASAVTVYAQTLYMDQRFEECAAVLEAAEQLEALTPDLGYALVRSLFLLGRTGEGRRALERLRARHPDAYGTLAATVQDMSGVIPMSERVDAARRLLGEGREISEQAAVAALLVLKDGAPAAEAAEAVRGYLEMAPVDSSFVWLGHALLASMEGRDGDAVRIIEEAEAALPSSYARHLARHCLWEYLDSVGDAARARAHVERWLAENPDEGRWFARRAAMRAAQGDREGAFGDAREALRRFLEPHDVLVAVRAAGYGALTLDAELDAQAARNPGAWQVELARIFVHQAEGAEAALEALDYASGRRVRMMALLSELELAALEDGVAQGLVDPAELSHYRWDLLERIVDGAGRLEGDATAWGLLVSMALHQDRALQAARAVRHHLGARIAEGTLPPELSGTVALALLAVGDLEPLGAVRAVLPSDLPETASMGWFEVALRALRDGEGDAGVARTLAAKLGAPGAQALGVPDAWRALDAARAGRAEDAHTALAALVDTQNGVAIALAAAAHQALGEHAEAQACYELVLAERVQLAPYLRPLCLALVLAGGAPTDDERANLAFMASREGAGNPLFDPFTCLAAPSLAAFEGAHAYSIEGVEGLEGAGPGVLRLFVSATGRVDGFMTRAEGAPRTLEGSVDARGNLRARLTGADVPIDVLAKLAPQSVLRSHPTWSQLGQLFLLLDERGRASVWIGRPAQ